MASGPKIVKELLEKGAPGEDEAMAILKASAEGFDTVDEVSGYSALAMAVKCECFILARTLLSKGAQLGRRLEALQGRQAIHMIGDNNSVRLLTLLLEKKADCCAPDDQGNTALHLACRNGCYESAQIMLDNTDYDKYKYAEHNDLGFTPATSLVYGFLRQDTRKAAAFPRPLWEHLTKKLGVPMGSTNTAGLCLYYVSLWGYGEIKDRAQFEVDTVEVVKTILDSDPKVTTDAEYHDYLKEDKDTLDDMIDRFDETDESTHFVPSPLLHCFINNYSICAARIVELLCGHGAQVNEIYAPSHETFSYPLLAAAQLDDTAIADVLLKNKADMNVEPGSVYPDHGKRDATRLPFLFVLNKHFDFFLAHKPDVNKEDTTSGAANTAIHYAVYLPDQNLRLEKIRALLKSGASLNLVNNWGETALLAGVRPNFDISTKPAPVDITMAELLISAGSSVNHCCDTIPGGPERSIYGRCMPIHRAVILDDINLLELLVENKADLDARTPADGAPQVAGKSPLLLACSMVNRCAMAVEIAHKDGVDVNAVDIEGRSALLLASMHPPLAPGASESAAWEDVIYFLMDKNPDLVNQPDNNGITPLHAACESGNYGTAELLLNAGAKICKDANGITPTHIVARHSNHQILDLLVNADGFNANAIELTKEYTPLFFFPETPNPEQALEFAKHMLNAGADPRYMTSNKYTCVMEAITAGYKEIAELYMANGGSKVQVSNEGASALSAACQQEMWDLVEHLVASGANLHVVDDTGDTPCMRALNAGQEKIVKLMISKGAKVDAQSSDGSSLLVRLRREGLVKDKIVVEYCINCNLHAWTTRHVAEKYEEWFMNAKKVFEDDGYEVLGNPLPPNLRAVNSQGAPTYKDRTTGKAVKFPPLGAFEIYIVSGGGERYRMFSKIDKGYWPRLSLIRKNLERASVRINFPDQMVRPKEDDVEARRPMSARSEPGGKPRITFTEDINKPSPRSMQRPLTAR